MRKLLLGTTAMIGAFAFSHAAQAQTDKAEPPITVTLGGAFSYQAALTNEDNQIATGTRDYGMSYDASVLLGAEGKAANNLVYGLKLQLTPDQNATNATDEYYGYVSGNWGRTELGAVDGAADRLTVFAPSDFGTGGVTGKYTDFISVNNPGGGQYFFSSLTSVAGLDQTFKAFDSEGAVKATYFSPRFAGFQFGASFAPDGGGPNVGTKAERSKELGAAGISTAGSLNRSGFENIYEVGVNYVTDFSGVGVAASGAYVGGTAKNVAGSATSIYEDLSAYAFGLNASYMGWTLGGGYVNNGESGLPVAGTNNTETSAYNVGLQYAFGPFITGVNALFAEGAGNPFGASDSTLDAYSVGTTYVVAPGFSTFLEATMFEFSTDAGIAAGQTVVENEGSVIMLGAAMEF